MKVIKMNNKFLIDYIQLYRSQLNELYKTLQMNDKYDEKLLDFVKKVVLINECSAYDLLKRLINDEETYYDIQYLNKVLNEVMDLIDNGLSIKNNDAKKQIEKCINYSKVLEALLLDALPDIEDEYFVSSTLSIELLEGLNDLIK